jgi:hypothetical protein
LPGENHSAHSRGSQEEDDVGFRGVHDRVGRSCRGKVTGYS